MKRSIHLTIDNLQTYGFACFHYKNEESLKNSFWNREIEFSVKAEIIEIPKQLLVELSKVDKVVHSENYIIQFDIASIDPVKLLSERAGWNQTPNDLEAMKTHGKNGYVLATYHHENQDIPLGSGLSLPVSDDMSWIGMILVHPELRRQGIARSIMNASLEHARLVQNKSIVGLDATPQGKQVYDSLGFVDSYKIWRSDICTTQDQQSIHGVELKSFVSDSVEKYLKRKNNSERFPIAELLAKLPDSKNIMAESDGVVIGFAMSRPGRTKPFVGPIIADSEEVALSLLNGVLKHWKSMEFAHAFIDVPEQHIGQNSIFINEDDNSTSPKRPQISIKPLRSFVRMYQLISDSEVEENLQKSTNEDSIKALEKAKDSYEKTVAYMEKEKQKILPSMYAIGGPEMS